MVFRPCCQLQNTRQIGEWSSAQAASTGPLTARMLTSWGRARNARTTPPSRGTGTSPLCLPPRSCSVRLATCTATCTTWTRALTGLQTATQTEACSVDPHSEMARCCTHVRAHAFLPASADLIRTPLSNGSLMPPPMPRSVSAALRSSRGSTVAATTTAGQDRVAAAAREGTLAAAGPKSIPAATATSSPSSTKGTGC